MAITVSPVSKGYNGIQKCVSNQEEKQLQVASVAQINSCELVKKLPYSSSAKTHKCMHGTAWWYSNP